jgi:hypothetical protein
MLNEIKNGTKYILRTDVIYEKIITNTKEYNSYFDQINFNKSVEYFREAQNQELEKIQNIH